MRSLLEAVEAKVEAEALEVEVGPVAGQGFAALVKLCLEFNEQVHIAVTGPGNPEFVRKTSLELLVEEG